MRLTATRKWPICLLFGGDDKNLKHYLIKRKWRLIM